METPAKLHGSDRAFGAASISARWWCFDVRVEDTQRKTDIILTRDEHWVLKTRLACLSSPLRLLCPLFLIPCFAAPLPGLSDVAGQNVVVYQADGIPPSTRFHHTVGTPTLYLLPSIRCCAYVGQRQSEWVPDARKSGCCIAAAQACCGPSCCAAARKMIRNVNQGRVFGHSHYRSWLMEAQGCA